MAAPAGEREEGEKGKKRKKKGGEVATDRWTRMVSGAIAGCAGRRVGWAERKRRATWLAAAHIRRFKVSNRFTPILILFKFEFQFKFRSTQINSNKDQIKSNISH
jgi:hypothetical protein